MGGKSTQGIIGAGVHEGEGFDLSCSAIPQGADGIDAFYSLRFLRAVRDVAFATVDAEGLPSVRTIDVMAVERMRLFFLVPRGKALWAELERQPFVALVGQLPDLRMCRLRGPVRRAQSEQQRRELVDMMFELNPGMDELYPGDSRNIIDAFWIEEGQGEFFDLGQKPLLRVPFALGGRAANGGGYAIGSACDSCGTCLSVCPTGVIEPGTPYHIRQESCLHCGSCYEACPSRAIERKKRTWGYACG